METAVDLPSDWDVNNPYTWDLFTTIDAHCGYHHTGMVMRELREIRHEATEYGVLDTLAYDEENGPQVWERGALRLPEDGEMRGHAEWWYGVLSAMHDAAIAVGEASPERIERAMVALGLSTNDQATIWDHLDREIDLENLADLNHEITSALESARIAA